MTTIAYRDGVLAADSIMTAGGDLLGRATKIARNEHGDLAGAAGGAGYNAAFLKWFLDGENGDPPKATSDHASVDRGVIFRKSGAIRVFEPDGSFDVRAPYYALGSGRPEALGAMFAGADAVTAVQAGIEHDPNTRGPITVLRHVELAAVEAA